MNKNTTLLVLGLLCLTTFLLLPIAMAFNVGAAAITLIGMSYMTGLAVGVVSAFYVCEQEHRTSR